MLPAARDLDRGFWSRLARAIMRRPVRFLARRRRDPRRRRGARRLAEGDPRLDLRAPAGNDSVAGSSCCATASARARSRPTEIVIDTGQGAACARRSPRAPSRGSRTRRSTTRRRTSRRAAAHAPYVDATGRYARVYVVGRHEYGAEQSRQLVQRIRAPRARARASPRACASTSAARRRKASTTSRARTRGSRGSSPPRSLLTYLVLLRAFRSVLLPLKAVLLNVLSVAAVYGLLVVIFQWGVGADLLGLVQGRPDRRLDPDLPLRDALRPLDGLRGLPRHAHARGVGRDARQRARRRARPRAHRPDHHGRRAHHGRRVLAASSPAASPACRSSAPASRSRS